jgi:nucleoside-diphosphate-sugar epimerase
VKAIAFDAFTDDEPRPEAGARKSWGREFGVYTNNVEDAVSATVTVAARGRPGTVYNIGGGAHVGLLEVFEVIGPVVGRPLRLDRLDAQRGDMRDTYADTRRACTDLGFAPSVTLEQGLRARRDWMADVGA